MTILLTGATGFLGRYLVDELVAAGHEVRVLVRHAAQRDLPWRDLVTVVDGDVQDLLSVEQALEGAEAVIHAAGLVSFRRRDKAALLASHVQGTANIVNLCLEMGISRLVHVSTIGALGRPEDKALITEATPWQNRRHLSGYAIAKHKAELEVQRGVAEGLSAVCVNPGIILGAGDWTQGTPQLFRLVDQGLSFYPAGSSGYVGAADVARACHLLLEAPVNPGSRFILVGENLTQREFLTRVAHALHRRPPALPLPAPLALAAGWLAEAWADLTGSDAQMSVASMRSASDPVRFDGTAICRLGFQYTPLDTLIADIAHAYTTRT
ncbi:MAG: NAD(P)H-binding protein [Bacteroidia bacterium]|nr:NAD(P)H-binding protein [Bacteroidia bacterium]